MMNTRSGGEAAAAPWLYFSRIVPAPVCLAVEFVPEGSSWPWVALVGMEGLDGLGRPNAADRPDQRGARERSGVC